MRALPRLLHNTPDIEIWPAHLLRARSNADARALALASHVLRRKRDGQFLATYRDARGVAPLRPALLHASGMRETRALLARGLTTRADAGELPLDRLHARLHALGVDADYAQRTGLPETAEPRTLQLAGFDRYRRPLWLRPDAARAWQHLQAAAMREGVVIESISGYRSHDYQLGIFDRKLARGQTLEQILTVNAAPGYSEHHSGRALDVGTPGEPPAEESFERTPAFAWLMANAAGYGFVLSYPRDNPNGIVYEPWHWRYEPAAHTAT